MPLRSGTLLSDTRLSDTHVLAPHFKRRLSGVTTTLVQLAPIQARIMAKGGRGFATPGPGLPPVMPRVAGVPVLKWLGLLRRTRSGTRRVWHARRNVEMLPAIVLRDICRAPLRILFTSASQREHTAYTRFLIGRMDRVVAVSERSGAYLRVPHEVVVHGIDTERFRPPGDRAALKAALGLDPAMRHVGCFGRIRARKGTGDFVEAMIEALPSRPGWTALVAGRATAEHAPYERDLRARVQAAGLEKRILLVGEHDDIHRWHAALDLYLAPQRWEGFGMTPLEAMACGVPVVATDAGAFPEMVTAATGRIVPRGDIEAMAREAGALMDDDAARAAMGEAAREHVVARFPLTGEAERLCAIYAEMLEG